MNLTTGWIIILSMVSVSAAAHENEDGMVRGLPQTTMTMTAAIPTLVYFAVVGCPESNGIMLYYLATMYTSRMRTSTTGPCVFHLILK